MNENVTAPLRWLLKTRKAVLIPLCMSLLSGCTMFSPLPPVKDVTPPPREEQNSYTLIEQQQKTATSTQQEIDIKSDISAAPLLRAATDVKKAESLALPEEPVSVNADGLPLIQFIHLTLGDVLGVNYVIDSALNEEDKPVTLRVNQPVKPSRLLGLVEEVLQVNGVALALQEDTLHVISAKKTKSQVPRLINESIQPLLKYNNVLEIVPVYYLSLNDASSLARRFLENSEGGKVFTQYNLNALMVSAKKQDIVRIKELLARLDVPKKAGQHISLVSPRFVTVENLIADLQTGLSSAGVPVSQGNSINGVVLNALSNNQLLVTASTQEWLSYALEWSRQLDKPQPTKSSNGVYAYYMQNAKAEDVWSVVSALFGKASQTQTEQTRAEQANIIAAAQQRDRTGSRPTTTPGNTGYQSPKKEPKGDMSLSTENYKVVVDSKRNALFFTGEYSDYQRLINLLKFVDKRPRQVLMQATIAEVNVSDGFSLGVDFNAQGSGDISGGTSGLIESGNLNLAGIFGDVTANFSAALDTGRAQVLSSPRIIALDQEPARINIGNQIQVRTGEVTDGGEDNTATVTYQYIDVGITLDITPSINQNGLVELTISQEVSNQGADVGGGPSINRRSIQTKVLADSGDTIYLGGLIKQDTNNTENKVPLLGDIPLLGNLFKYQKQKQDSVELVLLITPYMINSREDAQFYTKAFRDITGWTLAESKAP
jgi:Type II secretory pathway, component PulD